MSKYPHVLLEASELKWLEQVLTEDIKARRNQITYDHKSRLEHEHNINLAEDILYQIHEALTLEERNNQ